MMRIAICLLVLCMAEPAWGQATKPMMGPGAKASCGVWLEDRKHPGKWLDLGGWALGFLTGVGMYRPDLNPLNGIDVPAVDAWLDKYCRKNPLTPFYQALHAFVAEHPR